jgi:hypothetical protein
VACDNGGVDDISTLLMEEEQVHESYHVVPLWATSTLLTSVVMPTVLQQFDQG